MASPLEFRGGLQLTQQNSQTSAALRWRRSGPAIIPETGNILPAGYPLHFRRKSSGVILETVYTQHVSLEFGGHNLALTPSGVQPPAANTNRMFFMFG